MTNDEWRPGKKPGDGDWNSSLFANAGLARRIERAETTLVLEGASAASRRVPAGLPFVRELNGGAAVFVEPGSPFNKGVGFGFEGVPDERSLDQIEVEFARRATALQFEVSNLADPELARRLTRRGYELTGFENVLGAAIQAHESSPAQPAANDVVVRRASDAESQAWLDVVASGFMHPDVFDGPASHESFSREALERVFGDTIAARGFERFLAWRGGELAGGASFRIEGRVAQLSGAATLPEHRRRGVQTALLRHRLHQAASRGCDIAVVTTQPGSKSQENVQKAGFALLYTRAVLVKQP